MISTPLDLAVRSQPSPKPTVDVPTKVTPARSGASYPGIKTSKIDVDAKPRYEPNGKPITEIDMDAGASENDFSLEEFYLRVSTPRFPRG